MRSVLSRMCLYGAGLAMLIFSTAGSVFASGPAPAPEIDGSSIAAGLAALSAAVLIVRSRRRAK